jgi:hypothetical protein
MVVVAGPRIDPRRCRARRPRGRAYVHELYRHLAACDLAVVQGGLTTTMELTANRRPFLYFPLRHHFEQNFHVRHRLDRYGAGRCMDFDARRPDVIAAAIAEEIGRERRLPPSSATARRAPRLDRGAALISSGGRVDRPRDHSAKNGSTIAYEPSLALRDELAARHAASAFCTFVAAGRRWRRR